MTVLVLEPATCITCTDSVHTERAFSQVTQEALRYPNYMRNKRCGNADGTRPQSARCLDTSIILHPATLYPTLSDSGMNEELLLLPKKYKKSKYDLVSITYSGSSLDIRFDSWKWLFCKKDSKYELKLPNGEYMLLPEEELYQVANKVLEIQLNSPEMKIETLKIDEPFTSSDAFRLVKISNMGMLVAKSYPPNFVSAFSKNVFETFWLCNDLNSADLMKDVANLNIDNFWLASRLPKKSMIWSFTFKKWNIETRYDSSRDELTLMDMVQIMSHQKPPIGCSYDLILTKDIDTYNFFDEVDLEIPEMEKISYAGQDYRFIKLEYADLVIFNRPQIYTTDMPSVIIRIDDGKMRKFGLNDKFFIRYYSALAIILRKYRYAVDIVKLKYPSLYTQSLPKLYDWLVSRAYFFMWFIGLILSSICVSFYILYKLHHFEFPWAALGVLVLCPIPRIFECCMSYACVYYAIPPNHIIII